MSISNIEGDPDIEIKTAVKKDDYMEPILIISLEIYKFSNNELNIVCWFT